MTEEGVTERIANDLRERIKRGEFGTRGRLPAITDIARQWGCVRQTVYDAIHILQHEALVVSQEKAFYARYPILRIPGITPTFDRYLIDHGIPPAMENVIEPELIEMPAEIAALFGQAEGVHVVHRMRRQGAVGVPYRLAENWYPADLAGQFVEQMRADSNMDILAAIKRERGVIITDVHENVLARIPTAREAELLSILRTAPVFEVRRSNFAQDGRPVMFNKIILVGAFFELSYDYKPDHWK